jgi:hypothetical protein
MDDPRHRARQESPRRNQARPEEARLMKTIAIEGRDLAVWVGPGYEFATPRVLILGESRYDDEFTDRMIIEYRVAGRYRAGRRTFTNSNAPS